MRETYAKLRKLGKVYTNRPIDKYTTYKVGGPADFFVKVDKVDKLIEILGFLNEEGIDYLILGKGSNVIINDDGFRGVVLCIEDTSFSIEDNIICASAGATIASMVQAGVENGLSGFEWASGMPGTIGGSVRGNAGAYNRNMEEIVKSVEVWRDGEVLKLTNEECGFGYKDSIFKHNHDVILHVWLEFEKKNRADIKKKMSEYLDKRSKQQPKFFGSCGCFFKNIEIKKLEKEIFNSLVDNYGKELDFFIERKMIPAGWLIEQAGMKGKEVGQAQVSTKHANFIINNGKASASDILQLIDKVKQAVYNRFRINLEEEVQIV